MADVQMGPASMVLFSAEAALAASCEQPFFGHMVAGAPHQVSQQQLSASRSSSVTASLDPAALSDSAHSLLPAIGAAGAAGAGDDNNPMHLHQLQQRAQAHLEADALAQLTAAGLEATAGGGVVWTCAGCLMPIYDQFLLQVADGHWHESCLKCAACGQHLSSSSTCFVRNAKIYCEKDYRQQYCMKCGRCYEPLSANDYVQRSHNQAYHVRCFTCVYCGVRLAKGDEYLMVEGQIICRQDYDLYMCNSLATAQKLGEAARGKAIKRPRTILSSSQRRAFKAAFEQTSKPCRKVREQLARDTGLSVRVVQVWFQNQRAKVKKIQRKQEMQRLADIRKGVVPRDPSAAGCALAGEPSAGDARSPPSSPASDDGNFSVAGDSDTGDSPALSAAARVDRGGQQSYAAYQLHHQQQQQTPPQHANPIEQLYSMQNAYFLS